jgi:serine protease Do
MIVGGGTGIGFAIPANLARLVGNQLIEHGSVRRAYIGLQFQALTPELAKQFSVQSGALVTSVKRGEPADKAGVNVGDVVVSLDATPIRESRELTRLLLEKPIGARLRLGLVRDGKSLSATLVTAERKRSKKVAASRGPSHPPETRELGLRLETLTPERAARLGRPVQQGAVVISLVRGSAADRAGLAEGDLIVEADRKPVKGAADVAAALADGTALLRVLRREGATYLVVSKPH